MSASPPARVCGSSRSGAFDGSRADDPFAEVYAAWLGGDLDRRLPGGETGAELRQRMHHVLYAIAERHQGETVLAVSHGGLMRLTLPLILTRRAGHAPGTPGQLCRGRAVQRRPSLDLRRLAPGRLSPECQVCPEREVFVNFL